VLPDGSNIDRDKEDLENCGICYKETSETYGEEEASEATSEDSSSAA
jgi:hypothetical protein